MTRATPSKRVADTWKLVNFVPSRRHPIQVRRLETFCAENSDVGIALVVGEDDDDVGRPVRAVRRNCRKRES